MKFEVASADKVTTVPWRWVSGATVKVYNRDLPAIRYSVKTDGNGVARFNDLPSGRYGYSVSAEGYMSVSSNTVLEAGKVQGESVCLPTEMVTYTWSVEPTTIQDKYDIKLKMTYKTDVEAPAIVIEPKSLNLKMEGGESRQVIITVENKGRISAFNVKVLEAIGDEAVKVYTPNPTIGELKAGEKVSIPVTVTLVHANCHIVEIPVGFEYCSACGRVTMVTEKVQWWFGDCDGSVIGGGTAGGGGSGGTEVGGGGGSEGGGGGSILEIPPGTGSNCGTEPGGGDEGIPTSPIDPNNPDPVKRCPICKSYDTITGLCLPFTDLEGKTGACTTGVLSSYSHCVKGACVLSKQNCEIMNQDYDGRAYSAGCPNRVQNEVPRSSNGCGGSKYLPSVQSWMLNEHDICSVSVVFKQACDKHDLCFGGCNNVKSSCDLDFMKDLSKICKDSRSLFPEVYTEQYIVSGPDGNPVISYVTKTRKQCFDECMVYVRGYYSVVSSIQVFYTAGQNIHCACADCNKYKMVFP